MLCPKCGGPMWDNTTNKKNPKAPDYKCKDVICVDEKGFVTAVWLKKEPFNGFQGTPPPATKVEPKTNGTSTEMMRLAYRKDLMVALVNKMVETATTDTINLMFDDLWSNIEK